MNSRSTLNAGVVDQAVNDLRAAELSRRQIGALSESIDGLDLVGAYDIQRALCSARLHDGTSMIGHKVGLTSRAMQAASGVNEPDFGRLFKDRVFNNGDRIAIELFCRPAIEVEVAFVLGHGLSGAGCQTHDVLRAVEFVMPALEIIDSRIEPPLTDCDSVADNASFGAIVLGGSCVAPSDVDAGWVSATLTKNGIIEESGVSAAVLGHPANAVAWLVNQLATHGEGLEPGEIVLSGSFTRALPVAPGDIIAAQFDALGSLTVAFT